MKNKNTGNNFSTASYMPVYTTQQHIVTCYENVI